MMPIFKAKLPFFPLHKVKYELQNEMSTLSVVENLLIIDKQLIFIIDLFSFLFSLRKKCFTFYFSKKQKLNRFVILFELFDAQFSPFKLYTLNSHHNMSLSRQQNDKHCSP